MESSLSTRGTGTTRSDWCGALNKLRRPDFLPPMCLVGALHCKSVLSCAQNPPTCFAHRRHSTLFVLAHFTLHIFHIIETKFCLQPMDGALRVVFSFFFNVRLSVSKYPSSILHHTAEWLDLCAMAFLQGPTLPLQMVEPECVGESQ